ncbi:MAG TPA: sugar transferase, partial [Verrucomicrobiales bacterium]|nr:sugar transferase [Verrucomicrobiales bacterium]
MAEIPTIPTPKWKRLLDFAVLLVLAPLILPVALLVALFVRLVSPGPALFTQVRIGRGGAPFVCYKFRTMKVNAATAGHEAHLQELIKSDVPMVKLDKKGDDRLIRGGALLRASGLDELAQLL